MRKLALVLAVLIALPLLAAGPSVSEKGNQIEITLPAGHTAVWVAFDVIWFTLSATDADGDGKIVVDAEDFGLTWIVADQQTGEWTISPRMTQQPLPAGTILPVTGGKYGVIVLPSEYLGGALWIRPNVGAWAQSGINLAGFPSGPMTFIEPTPLFNWGGVGTPAAPPADGFRRGDVLLVMSRFAALTGTVDAQLDAPPNPGVIGFDRTGIEFEEGKNMFFDLIRTGGTSGTVTVRCCNFGGTAVPGLDFTPPAEQDYVFAPGEYYKHVVFPLLDDSRYAGPRTVRITPVSVSGAALQGITEAVLTIRENDAAPVIGFGDLAASYSETDTPWTLQVPVKLTGAIRGSYTVLFEASSPRMATMQVPIVFGEGETLKIVEIPIPADDAGNSAYTITLRLPNVTRTVRIIDDDLPQMQVAPAITVRENERNGTLEIKIDPDPASAVQFSVRATDGTAFVSSDFERINETPRTTNGSTVVNFTIVDDRIPEGPETFYLELTSISGPVTPPEVMRIPVTILDNDADLPFVDVVSARTYEGNSGERRVPVRVRLSKPMPTAITMDVTATESRATRSDFLPVTRPITFPAGATEAIVEVLVYGDTDKGEGNESLGLKVTWEGLLVTWGTLEILDDDDYPPTIVTFPANAFEKTGTSSTAVFNVFISQTAKLAGSVRYSTVDGTAKAGLDYVAASGTATFRADTQSFDIPVEIIGDAVSESTEDFFLKLEGQPEWLALSPASATIKANLYDDDSPNAPQRIRVGDAHVVEGNDWREAVFTVSLSRPAPQDVSVSYTTRDVTATAGLDYEAKSGATTIAAGQSTQEIRVRIAGDHDDELLEMFELVVNSQTPVEDGVGVCVIEDDETVPPKRHTSRH